MQRSKFPGVPRRADIRSPIKKVDLQDFVTKRTSAFFNMLMENGEPKSQQFLQTSPKKWLENPIYCEMQILASKVKVVNDTAERGISLIQQYNERLTKDEYQKQFLLRLVHSHRKNFPTPSKAALMNT